MNLRIITKNHVADPEIGFLKKSISKPYGRATAMPLAWELTYVFDFNEHDRQDMIWSYFRLFFRILFCFGDLLKITEFCMYFFNCDSRLMSQNSW